MEISYVIVAILLAGYGVFSLVAPEEVIHLQSFWKYDVSEPSERYIRMTRISGGFCIAAAIIILIFTFAS